MKEFNFDGTLHEFHQYIENNKKNKYLNYQEAKKDALQIQKKINKTLIKNEFNLLPSTDYKIEKIPSYFEKSQPGAYYLSESIYGPKRNGIFKLNGYNLLPKYDMYSLVVHEGSPGHHFQITIANDLKVPNFINYFGYPLTTAYDEGWAHYCETLPTFSKPLDKYGQLNSLMFRALRLVLDTGIHYKKWSKKKAMNYFEKNSGHTKKDIESEIDRYIVDP